MDFSAASAVSERLEGQPVLPQQRVQRLRVGIRKVAHCDDSDLHKLFRGFPPNVEQARNGQRPHLFLVAALGKRGSRVRLFHVASEL